MKRHSVPIAIRGLQAGSRLLFLIMTSLPVPMMPGQAYAHGQIGDRIFLSPIVGNDAFPDNAANLTVRRSDYAFSIIPELEKQLSNDSSLLFTGGWTRISPGAAQQQTSGSTDLWIYLRRAIYTSVPHEMEFTISPFVVAPVGNRRIADQGYTHLGGEALLGKGMGDLPDSSSIKLLRPLAIQAELGYANRVQGPANGDAVGNLELEYSLDYLDRFVEHVDLGRPWTGLVPYVQFNYAQSFIASNLTIKPDFRLTPGVAYQGWCYELSLAAQVALNGAAASGDEVAFIGLFEVYYDDIFPALGWNPL